MHLLYTEKQELKRGSTGICALKTAVDSVSPKVRRGEVRSCTPTYPGEVWKCNFLLYI